MNRAELVKAMAEKSGLSAAACDKALKAFVAATTDALKAGDKIQLVGFGTFEVRERKAREAVNPQKPGEKIKVPAAKVPAFKAGAALKEAVK